MEFLIWVEWACGLMITNLVFNYIGPEIDTLSFYQPSRLVKQNQP